MTAQARIAQLEKRVKPTDLLATAKPSEILALADKLIQRGYTPTKDERARLESLRAVIIYDPTKPTPKPNDTGVTVFIPDNGRDKVRR
jgi:hypothetical protein